MEVPAAITQAGNHATSIQRLKGYDAVQFYDVLVSGITVDCYASGLVDVSLTFDGEGPSPLWRGPAVSARL